MSNINLMEVQVRQIRVEAKDVVSIELVDATGGELPAFTPGAHIDLHLANGMVRSYSLLNSTCERKRYVLTSLGIERFHVVGRSMGGAIGQWMALKAPERVLSLAMLASFSVLDPVGKRSLENMREVLELTGSWAAHARHSVLNFVSNAFYNKEKERVAEIERIIASSDRLQACYVRQNHAVIAHNTLEDLHRISCPVAVLSGGRDPLCGPLATRWMVERLRNAEWTEFEASSHFFLMEEPERFMNAMDQWFAKVAF